MSIETYVLQEPVEYGKLMITEVKIDRRVKAKYHRVISKPIPTEMDGDRMIFQINPNGDMFAMIEAMTGQPQAIIDEMGKEDYIYLRQAAEDMAANFPGSLIQKG